MPVYRLLSTKRNPDGSMDTPSLDERLAAPDDEMAAHQASLFPWHRFLEESDLAWLLNEAGTVVWTMNLRLGKAA